MQIILGRHIHQKRAEQAPPIKKNHPPLNILHVVIGLVILLGAFLQVKTGLDKLKYSPDYYNVARVGEKIWNFWAVVGRLFNEYFGTEYPTFTIGRAVYLYCRSVLPAEAIWAGTRQFGRRCPTGGRLYVSRRLERKRRRGSEKAAHVKSRITAISTHWISDRTTASLCSVTYAFIVYTYRKSLRPRTRSVMSIVYHSVILIDICVQQDIRMGCSYKENYRQTTEEDHMRRGLYAAGRK